MLSTTLKFSQAKNGKVYRVHILKTVEPFFSDIETGRKPFEVRKNDRGFQVGDIIVLLAYSPKHGLLDKEPIIKRVDYVLQGEQYGLTSGYCVMSFDNVYFQGEVMDGINKYIITATAQISGEFCTEQFKKFPIKWGFAMDEAQMKEAFYGDLRQWEESADVKAQFDAEIEKYKNK